MVEWAEGIINQLGYAGISFLMFLETLFPPIPSEIVMPLAGFTASQGHLTTWGVVLAGIFGSTIGMLPLYFLGYKGGEDRLKTWLERHKQPLLSVEDVDKWEAWLNKHGGKAVFFSHVLPGVRSLISIPAGYIGMDLVKFLLLTVLGKGLWISILAVAGMLLGENYGLVDQYSRPISYLVTGAIILFIIIWIVRKIRASDSE